MNCAPQFLFLCCQPGAEGVVKSEIQRTWPEFRFSFSRPGFLTYKLPDDVQSVDRLDLRSTFVRTHGVCLGRVAGHSLSDRIGAFQALAPLDEISDVHLWHREMIGATGESSRFKDEVQAGAVCAFSDALHGIRVNQVVGPGQSVIDCILVEPDEWWVGLHRAGSMPSRWPGGIYPKQLPSYAVSRAYLKIAESVAWSRIPLRRGDSCAELGCAPGGSCQYLLDCGCHVIGVDPATVDPVVLGHPSFRHIRRRGRDVKRREFRSIRWLLSDSNVAPQQALDTVGDILGHQEVNIRGMLLTLKLAEWSLAEQLPACMERVASWGYEHVKARQLSSHRREICLFALRRRSMLRRPRG